MKHREINGIQRRTVKSQTLVGDVAIVFENANSSCGEWQFPCLCSDDYYFSVFFDSSVFPVSEKSFLCVFVFQTHY